MDNTPVENFYYHLSKGTMPDSIAGMKIYPQQLQKETFMALDELENMNIPEYGINPLFGITVCIWPGLFQKIISVSGTGSNSSTPNRTS